MGMTRKDLERILGGRSRVSEILKQRRGLSLAMIRRLSDELKMPADLLIAPTVRKEISGAEFNKVMRLRQVSSQPTGAKFKDATTTPKSGGWPKRDAFSGQFLVRGDDSKPTKGVIREKGSRSQSSKFTNSPKDKPKRA